MATIPAPQEGLGTPGKGPMTKEITFEIETPSGATIMVTPTQLRDPQLIECFEMFGVDTSRFVRKSPARKPPPSLLPVTPVSESTPTVVTYPRADSVSIETTREGMIDDDVHIVSPSVATIPTAPAARRTGEGRKGSVLAVEIVAEDDRVVEDATDGARAVEATTDDDRAVEAAHPDLTALIAGLIVEQSQLLNEIRATNASRNEATLSTGFLDDLYDDDDDDFGDPHGAEDDFLHDMIDGAPTHAEPPVPVFTVGGNALMADPVDRDHQPAPSTMNVLFNDQLDPDDREMIFSYPELVETIVVMKATLDRELSGLPDGLDADDVLSDDGTAVHAEFDPPPLGDIKTIPATRLSYTLECLHARSDPCDPLGLSLVACVNPSPIESPTVRGYLASKPREAASAASHVLCAESGEASPPVAAGTTTRTPKTAADDTSGACAPTGVAYGVLSSGSRKALGNPTGSRVMSIDSGEALSTPTGSRVVSIDSGEALSSPTGARVLHVSSGEAIALHAGSSIGSGEALAFPNGSRIEEALLASTALDVQSENVPATIVSGTALATTSLPHSSLTMTSPPQLNFMMPSLATLVVVPEAKLTSHAQVDSTTFHTQLEPATLSLAKLEPATLCLAKMAFSTAFHTQLEIATMSLAKMEPATLSLAKIAFSAAVVDVVLGAKLTSIAQLDFTRIVLTPDAQLSFTTPSLAKIVLSPDMTRIVKTVSDIATVGHFTNGLDRYRPRRLLIASKDSPVLANAEGLTNDFGHDPLLFIGAIYAVSTNENDSVHADHIRFHYCGQHIGHTGWNDEFTIPLAAATTCAIGLHGKAASHPSVWTKHPSQNLSTSEPREAAPTALRFERENRPAPFATHTRSEEAPPPTIDDVSAQYDTHNLIHRRGFLVWTHRTNRKRFRRNGRRSRRPRRSWSLRKRRLRVSSFVPGSTTTCSSRNPATTSLPRDARAFMGNDSRSVPVPPRADAAWEALLPDELVRSSTLDAAVDAYDHQSVFVDSRPVPAGAAVIRMHWTHVVNASSKRKSRVCADGHTRQTAKLARRTHDPTSDLHQMGMHRLWVKHPSGRYIQEAVGAI